MWVGGADDAANALRGRAKFIINCANVDFMFPPGVKRSCSG